ncbi:MAG TPA: (2Fe-2S)-binding protein [Chloroflexota bacterium]
MGYQLQFRVNGRDVAVDVEPEETLRHVLRERLGLLSVRETCGVGICGACTVLVDGKPVSSCLVLAPLTSGRSVLTVEGLGDGRMLDVVQEAFVRHNAFQCSYCTPGFIMATRGLLAENPSPSADDVREYLAGNICRCGSYYKILAAVLDAARQTTAW